MTKPSPPPRTGRTCPVCNRPVEPGYKFCEGCGARMPELSTCSHCGTQFITPVKFCDLCGAPVILEEVPGPDGSPEHSEEAESVPSGDETAEYDNGQIPEQDAEEMPDAPDEEEIVTNEDEAPHHHRTKIQEPDTEALLEQFGDEYDEDETLESLHKPKSASRIKPETKKPFAIPGQAGRRSTDTVDDALFLSQKTPEAPARRPGSRGWIIGGGIVLLIILAAVFFIGLPLLTGDEGPPARYYSAAEEVTLAPEPTSGAIRPSPSVTPGPAPGALVPQPTRTIPASQKLYFQVRKNPITAKISVIFAGSAGEGSIRSAEVKVTHPDGSVASGIILPLKGVSEITLDGSREADRVEIIALMSYGETYRVYDELVPL